MKDWIDFHFLRRYREEVEHVCNARIFGLCIRIDQQTANSRMNAIAAKQNVATVDGSIGESDGDVCVGLVYPRQAFWIVDCNVVLPDRFKGNLKKVVAQDAQISRISRVTGAVRSIPVGKYFASH